MQTHEPAFTVCVFREVGEFKVNYFLLILAKSRHTDNRQTESDAYGLTVQFAQVGSKTETPTKSQGLKPFGILGQSVDLQHGRFMASDFS